MHPNSKLLFNRYAGGLFQPGQKVLEIGPDENPSTYRKLITITGLEWRSTDLMARPGVDDVMADEYHLPYADGTFDIILAGQVIEHVKKTWVWIKEVGRICKPGGKIVLINPVSWPYHEAPVDCWRIYPEGIKALAEDAGLEVVLSKFECLELEGYDKIVPGMTKGGSLVPLLRLLRFPIRGAYDTISILQKPS